MTEMRKALVREAPAETLREALDRLVAELLPHLAKEDVFIHPALMAAPDIASSDAARKAISDFADTGERWEKLDQDWTEARIAEDREGFVAAFDAVADRNEQRIRRENDLLYPMALRASLIRLRAGT